MLVTTGGRLIRLPADQVRLTGRAAQGVTLFRLDPGEAVISAFGVTDATAAEDAGEGSAA
jgi:DNA gyrase subunit A